jgi:hypothetical protein
MDPQPTTIKNFNYVATALPGTFAAATISSSDPSVAPVVQNLLLTSTGNATYNVAGTQNPSNEALTGTYTLNDNSIPAAPLGGTGAIALTTPSVNYVIYAIDGNANDAITDFMMMGTCVPQAPATTCASGPASSIMFAQE